MQQVLWQLGLSAPNWTNGQETFHSPNFNSRSLEGLQSLVCTRTNIYVALRWGYIAQTAIHLGQQAHLFGAAHSVWPYPCRVWWWGLWQSDRQACHSIGVCDHRFWAPSCCDSLDLFGSTRRNFVSCCILAPRSIQDQDHQWWWHCNIEHYHRPSFGSKCAAGAEKLLTS